MTKPGLLLFMTDIDAAHETEFHRWYEEEHIRERLAIPGFLTPRRTALSRISAHDWNWENAMDATHGAAVRQCSAQRLRRDFGAASLIAASLPGRSREQN